VLLARAQLRLGQREEARQTLDRFFDQWQAADPEHPLLAQARAVEAELSRLPSP
jgi:hypothetical protein